MWFIQEPGAAQNHAGASGETRLDETTLVSIVMFLLRECFENRYPFSIPLPHREPGGDEDVEIKFSTTQWHRTQYPTPNTRHTQANTHMKNKRTNEPPPLPQRITQPQRNTSSSNSSSSTATATTTATTDMTLCVFLYVCVCVLCVVCWSIILPSESL